MSYTGLKPSLEGIAHDSSTDNATGSAVTLTAPSAFTIRLTNASLVSVAGIPAAGRDGEEIVIQNDTGVDIDILNDTTATAADRIYTGIGVDALLRDEQSLRLNYSTTSSRWMVVGYIEAT